MDEDDIIGGAGVPAAKTAANRSQHHGIELNDPYAWLRAENWQEVMRDPDVLDQDIRSYLEAENSFTQTSLADTQALQEQLFAEMKGRIKEDDSSVPSVDGDFAYFIAYEIGDQHPLYCRSPRDGGDHTVLIDGNRLAEGFDYFQLGSVDHSPDHKYVAYGADDNGSEFYTVKIRDITNDHELADIIPDTAGGGVWSADSKSLFYTKLDENHRPSKVYQHVLGTDIKNDRLVYEELDSGFFVGVGKTQSADFIVVSAHDHVTSEAWLIDAHAPEAEPRCVAKRQPGIEYDVEHHGDKLFILTNADDAEDFKIVEAPLVTPERENWKDLISHVPGRLLISFTVLKNHMIRLEREDGLPRVVVRALANAEEHDIAFDEEAYSLGLGAGYEFDTQSLRFTYSSMTTPAQIFDYDMVTRTRLLRKTQEVPSGHDPAQYVTARIMAPAHDGQEVPISLLYKKGTKLDGSAPLLLYGYGAYGISIPASFTTNRLSLVDRGVIYAIAHIRGGKDKGYGWYKDGRLENKTNSFHDFISAGKHLADEKYTSHGNIIAHGGSAGGMLMGAVANMAPELFKAILAEVPFVDVLNTMLDSSLPLTPPEWPEWGNPIESAEAFKTIQAYAPYENVAAQDYPNILAVAGLTDPRVTYWEPAKWVAKLRAVKTDDNLVLLKTNMSAGHGGAAGRFDRLEEVALTYAFALKMWGMPT